MEALPVELRRDILQRLPPEDLRSIRLVSRSLADLGLEYLIEPQFRILPHRDDCIKLLSLSRHPILSSSVERLIFDMGEADRYHARHNTYFLQYMRDPEDKMESWNATWEEYLQVEFLKESYADTYCEHELLMQTIGNLPRLSAIDVSMLRCPFKDDLWQLIWHIPTTKALPRAATMRRFRSILSAAVSKAITSLSHDRLPFEFLVPEEGNLNVACKVCSGLQILRLGLDCPKAEQAPQPEFCFQGLADCLRAAPHLRVLDLSFSGLRGGLPVDITFSALIGDAYVWPELDTFLIKGVRIDAEDLAAFLSRHAASLKRLQLGDIGSDEPGWAKTTDGILHFRSGDEQTLYSRLQSTMRLEKLGVRAYDSPALYDEYWNRIGCDDSWAAKLEGFVIKGSPWPERDEYSPPLSDEESYP